MWEPTCALTCRLFARAASEPEIWQEMAVRKYGEQVAEATLDLYEGSWKSMMANNNKRGALPTLALTGYRQCYWLSNTINRFYCCLLTAIQWDRRNGKVRVYLDARGEEDLRHPRASSVVVRGTPPFLAEAWVADVEKSGHYKGCLIFDEARFQSSTEYVFCYANLIQETAGGRWTADYDSFTLFYESINDLWFQNYTLDASLFANETPEIERDRWAGTILMQIVPDEVLERQDWWVE